jgi:hypothetical protein
MQRFAVAIEGPEWEDIQDIELPAVPREGETIETKYGTCLVTSIEQVAESSEYAGRIICRLP